MPTLGVDVLQTPPAKTKGAVTAALQTGYRLIDSAATQANEDGVGDTIRESGVAGDEVFIETKVWISEYGYDQTLHAFETRIRKLGVDHIDLLLLHQALRGEFDKTLAAHRALETLLADGKVRAIGVSNLVVAGYRHPVDAAAEAHACSPTRPQTAFQEWIALFVDFFVTKHGLADALNGDTTSFTALHHYFVDRLVPVCAQLLTAGTASIARSSTRIRCCAAWATSASAELPPDTFPRSSRGCL